MAVAAFLGLEGFVALLALKWLPVSVCYKEVVVKTTLGLKGLVTIGALE